MKKIRLMIKLFVYFGMLVLIVAMGLFLWLFETPATGALIPALDRLLPMMVISITITTLVLIYLLIIRRLRADKFGRTLLWVVNLTLVFLVVGYTLVLFGINFEQIDYSFEDAGLYILIAYLVGFGLLVAGIVFAFILMLTKQKPKDDQNQIVNA